MISYIIVGIGGFFGAISRYALSNAIKKMYSGIFPLGTFIVNALGCILIGAAVGSIMSDMQKLLIITGFIGSFTTFSTFACECYDLREENNLLTAIYAIATILFGYMGILVGIKISSIFL